MISIYIELFICIFFLFAFFFYTKSLKDLSEEFKDLKYDVVVKFGIYAERKCFNKAGWKYFKLFRRIVEINIILCIAFLIFLAKEGKI